jgi:hypothetical protein
MRKVIGWPISLGLFWLGDAVSKPMDRFGFGWLYPLYNWLMCRSCAVNDWAGLDLWTKKCDLSA